MAKKEKDSVGGMAGPAEDPPLVPSVTWEELVERAEAELDENGATSMEKRRHVAEKKWRRLKERGLRMNVDCEKVKRAIVAYYADCFESERSMGIRKVFARSGALVVDYTDGKNYWPELWMVMDYIDRHRRERDRLLAAEAGSLAQESQMRLVTEEGCDLNQKAVEVSLKATMKDVYGDGSESGESKRKPIMYNLPGLTVNMIMPPSELEARRLDGATPVSEVIDV